MSPRISFYPTQHGAALVIGLILLMVLTLLAVAGMNSASLEFIMAGNEQFHQNAFQASETGIEQALVSGAFVPAAPDEVQPNVPVQNAPTDRYSTTISSDLCGKAQPAIWGNSWDSFSTYHFTVQSDGASVRSSRASHFQGVAIIAPPDPTLRPEGAGC